jgi:hypothetical protein
MWDDENEEDFHEEESKGNSYFQKLRETEKEMLKIDLTRGSIMPMGIEEWTELFGAPTEEDMFDITQAYFKQYHRNSQPSIYQLVEAFGIEWINFLLSYNEEQEEYELCAILKSHLDVYKRKRKPSGDIKI